MPENASIIINTGAELLILAAASGAVSGSLWILPAPESAAAPGLRRGLWRMLGLCVALLVITTVMELLLRTASMSELPLRQAWGEIGTVLHKTHYGRLWLGRAASVICLGLIWLVQWRDQRARLPAFAAFATLIITVVFLSASGHGGDDGVLATANLANSLHILAALLWGGAILAAALVIVPGSRQHRQEPTRALLAASSLRLSTLAGIALALTLLPGIYNAWSLVGSWQGLWGTPYGRLLLAKIILVGAMIALGAVNRYRYVPALQAYAGGAPPRPRLPLPLFLTAAAEGDAARGLLRSLRAEALLLLAVLALAAALSQETPAIHADHGMRPAPAHALGH